MGEQLPDPQLPDPIAQALDHVCDSAVEMSGCQPGFAIEPLRIYANTVRVALSEALAHVPPRVRDAVAGRLDAAWDVCDARVSLAEAAERERQAAIEAPGRRAGWRKPREGRRQGPPLAPRRCIRTPKGHRAGIILRAVAAGHVTRASLLPYVAEAMGETENLPVSRNRTVSMLWSLGKKGRVLLEGDSVRLPGASPGVT